MYYYHILIYVKILILFRSLKNEDFDLISTEIEELFPTETSSTYYVPPIAKKHSKINKSITSRGKLVDKYRNKIRDYKKLTGYNLTDCSSTSTTTPTNSELEGMYRTYFLYIKLFSNIYLHHIYIIFNYI